jgi:anti-sigma factor RsiW
MRCTGMQNKLIEYLDGRARPAERRAVEEHLSSCGECRVRAEQFRLLSIALDDLPLLSPSPAFDASLRARIAAEPAQRRFWDLLPSTRLAFAVTALVVMSLWLSSMPRVPTGEKAVPTETSAESEFSMIRDLPVLENYDVLSKFDALSELPAPSTATTGESKKETR